MNEFLILMKAKWLEKELMNDFVFHIYSYSRVSSTEIRAQNVVVHIINFFQQTLTLFIIYFLLDIKNRSIYFTKPAILIYSRYN